MANTTLFTAAYVCVKHSHLYVVILVHALVNHACNNVILCQYKMHAVIQLYLALNSFKFHQQDSCSVNRLLTDFWQWNLFASNLPSYVCLILSIISIIF